MSFAPESLLTLLLLGIYLFDCFLLLNSNEVILELHRSKKWIPLFGVRRWLLARKEPLLLNPLTPWRLVLRRQWNAQNLISGSNELTEIQRPSNRLAVVAATLLLIEMMAVLPISLLLVPITTFKLVTIAYCYFLALVVLWAVYRDRALVGLSNRQAMKVCLEALACPPLCINLPRKLGLSARASLNLAVLLPQERGLACSEIRARALERLALVKDGSDEAMRLHELLTRLDAESAT